MKDLFREFLRASLTARSAGDYVSRLNGIFKQEGKDWDSLTDNIDDVMANLKSTGKTCSDQKSVLKKLKTFTEIIQPSLLGNWESVSTGRLKKGPIFAPDTVRAGERFRFENDPKLTRNAGCDAIINDISSLDFLEKLDSILAQIPELDEKYTETCRVVFAPEGFSEDLEENNEKIFKDLKKKCDKLCEIMPECGWLKEIFNDRNDMQDIPPEKLREIVERLKELLRSCVLPKTAEGTLKKILEDILNLRFNQKISLLGQYSGNTIYLYLETILGEAAKKCADSRELAEAIFVHEYAHHLHLTRMLRNRENNKENNLVKGVKETVAETVTYLFCQAVSPTITDWQEKHIKSERFPWWPYAGAEYVVGKKPSEIIGWLNPLIRLSVFHYKKALYYIEGIED